MCAVLLRFTPLGFIGRRFLPKGWPDFIKQLAEAGWKIIIFTTRATEEAAKDFIWDWLHRHGVRDLVSDITATKVPAQLYLDDRAVNFGGIYSPELVDHVKTFQPHGRK